MIVTKLYNSPGRALPLCWVIHMCRRFDTLFDLLRIEHDLLGVLFLVHQHQNELGTNPSRFFPQSFRVQFSATRGTHPPVFRLSAAHPHPGTTDLTISMCETETRDAKVDFNFEHAIAGMPVCCSVEGG